jgi:hypothetical protein
MRMRMEDCCIRRRMYQVFVWKMPKNPPTEADEDGNAAAAARRVQAPRTDLLSSPTRRLLCGPWSCLSLERLGASCRMKEDIETVPSLNGSGDDSILRLSWIYATVGEVESFLFNCSSLLEGALGQRGESIFDSDCVGISHLHGCRLIHFVRSRLAPFQSMSVRDLLYRYDSLFFDF